MRPGRFHPVPPILSWIGYSRVGSKQLAGPIRRPGGCAAAVKEGAAVLVELGILSLGDLQRDQRTGRRHRPVDRMAEILGYAVLADQLGLEVFAIGEHHSAEFFTSSPAVVLAAAAARTSGIRLTSATTLLGVADPVRVYEDFASLDVISRGRAEVDRRPQRVCRAVRAVRLRHR